MNKSFEDRVKSLFGSKLFETVPNNGFPSSSWSVADGEVERREWNREKGIEREDEELPCSTSFYDKKGCLHKKKSRRDKVREFEGNLGDDVDEEEENDDDDGVEERDEESEIRDSVGMDPTLDNEDEEDEYDKAALCKENKDERVYMSDVNNHGPYINFHAVVPDTIEEPINESHYFYKDPRADHYAANARLKEDTNVEAKAPGRISIADNDSNPKPILKRKDAQLDQKPKKKVRFDPEFAGKDCQDEISEETQARDENPKVPDYMRNPSKYTKYDFDSSETGDEELNKRAFEDFQNLVKKAEVELPVELPKTVLFTPRKKNVDFVAMDESPVNSKENLGYSVAIDNYACEMDEDDVEASDMSRSARRGRQYRSSVKSMSDDDM